jgi:type VI secretion system secreted protein Hcp
MDAYLKFDGVDGESMDKGHEKWIDVDEWTWNLEMPLTETKSSGGARTAGKIKPEPFTFKKVQDYTSPVLWQACCAGQHFDEVTFEVVKAVGSKDKKEVVCRYVFENVVIAKISTDGGDDAPTEELELDPGFAEFTYFQLNPKSGKAEGQLPKTWNFLKGVAAK